MFDLRFGSMLISRSTCVKSKLETSTEPLPLISPHRDPPDVMRPALVHLRRSSATVPSCLNQAEGLTLSVVREEPLKLLRRSQQHKIFQIQIVSGIYLRPSVSPPS